MGYRGQEVEEIRRGGPSLPSLQIQGVAWVEPKPAPVYIMYYMELEVWGPTSSWRPSWHLSFLVTLLQEAVLSRRVLTNSRTLMARVCLIGKCYLKNFDLLEL